MPDPRARDPRFPDRPTHPDFIRLSEAVQNHDAMAEQLGVGTFEILGVDEESFMYAVTNRFGILYQQGIAPTGTDRAHLRDAHPFLVALYLDAFALGKRFAEQGIEGDDDDDGTSGQDRESYTDTQDRDSYTVEERHDEDGKPYIAWFDRENTLGFIWSGLMEDEVQVTREMGEPIIATFPLPYDIHRRSDDGTALSRTLLAFQRVCEGWVREHRGSEFE